MRTDPGCRKADSDLVRYVDQTADGGTVAWVESPVTDPDPPVPAEALTLEQWRAQAVAGGPPAGVEGAAPGVADAGREVRADPPSPSLPVPTEEADRGRA